MKRHIWFPYLDGTRCVICDRPKVTPFVAEPCPGSPPAELAPIEPGRPLPILGALAELFAGPPEP